MKIPSIDGYFEERRRLLRTAASAAGFALVGGALAGPARGKEEEAEAAEVTPGEDLMQEHGVLERILLVYEEAAHRIEAKAALDVAVVASAAGILKRFLQGYHDRLEEEFVFPRLAAAGREVELVAVLLRQHAVGRTQTGEIEASARAGASPQLAQALRSFIRMYRPHAAHEDTVIFPAFRAVVGRAGYRELGEAFEAKEHEVLGERGFEAVVNEVAALERALGIGDLASFTAA